MLGTKPSIDAGLAITSQRDTHRIAGPAQKRPLRTYGRRTNVPVQDSEPKFSTQKKENTTAPPSPETHSDTIIVAMYGSESPSPSPSSSPPPQRSGSFKPNRNSILSYFKPVSHTPPEVAKDSDDADEEPSTLPPSPDSKSLPRKRRRLTTRPEIAYKQNSISVEEDRREEAKLAPGEDRDAPLREKKRKLQDTSPKGAHGAPFIAVTTPPDVFLQRNTSHKGSSSNSDENERPCHPQDPLRETSRSYLNKLDTDNHVAPSSSPEIETTEDDDINMKKPSSTSGENSQKMTTTKKKKKQKDLVQTTLSLAINPSPGFTICKECGILYNHLNENDRKEHKRRHAAYVRGKLKGGS